MSKALRSLVTLLTDPHAIAACLTWPRFSFASYSITTGLARQGVMPRTVIDVGANVGQFAIASAKTFPGAKVYSFEPAPDCVESLRSNTRALSGIEIFPVAVGDTSGTVELHVNRHAHSSSLLPLDARHRDAFPEAVETGSVAVPLRTIDEMLDGKDLPYPVLMKLDVQGYEPQALRGAVRTLARIDYLLIEVSFKPMYQGEMLFDQVAALAEQLGFRFLRPLDWLAHPGSGEILQMDALFVPLRDHATA